MDYGSFSADAKTVKAVELNLIVIGEASIAWAITDLYLRGRQMRNDDGYGLRGESRRFWLWLYACQYGRASHVSFALPSLARETPSSSGIA